MALCSLSLAPSLTAALAEVDGSRKVKHQQWREQDQTTHPTVDRFDCLDEAARWESSGCVSVCAHIGAGVCVCVCE